MATQDTTLGPFSGIATTTQGEVPMPYASNLLNVTMEGGIVRPRLGYREFSVPGTAANAAWGFAHLRGYDETSLDPLEEYVTIEGRSGNVRPYSVHPVTGARTAISSVGLAESLWTAASLKSASYFVNPDSAAGIYRHTIGDPTSWVAVQSVTYQPPGSSGGITLDVPAYPRRSWSASDTNSTASSNGIKNRTVVVLAGGDMEIRGDDDDNGVTGSVTLTSTFATAANFSPGDYLAVQAVGGTIFKQFVSGAAKVQLLIGGVWITPTEQREFLGSGSGTWAMVVRLKGVSGTSAIQGIKVQVKSKPVRFTSGLGFTIKSIVIGGAYLNALASTRRLWDTTLDSTQIEYGVRYVTVETTPKPTAISALSLPANRVIGLAEGPSCPLGSFPQINAGTQTASPWVEDPTGTVANIQFLRKGKADGKWRILGTLPNVAGQTWSDVKEEWELAALTEATGTVYTPPDPPTPYFSTLGMVSCFSWRSHMVWLRKGGSENVLHSAINAPEELANPGDETDDDTAGANFTLADNSGDEGICGVGIGGACVIFGRRGAYAQVGNTPRTLTPPRQIVGAPGVCGRLGCAAMPMDGIEGAAFVDVAATRVLWVGGSSVYETDSGVRPVDLTRDQAGVIRGFLLSQLAYTAADIRVAYNVAADELWVLLGRRAMVLRAPSPIDGQRRWELMSYAFAAGQAGTGGGGSEPDFDGDGIPDATDPDDDNDGDPDVTDPAPHNASISSPVEEGAVLDTLPNYTSQQDTVDPFIDFEDHQAGSGFTPGEGGSTPGDGGTTPPTDTDGDGIPDMDDPYPDDPTNGTGGGGGGGGGINNTLSFITFAEPRRLRVLDSTGRIIELEWNSATQLFIDGDDRDGGLVMPDGFWESGWRRGNRRRLFAVAVDPPSDSGHAVTSYVEGGDPAGTPVSVVERWQRMPMSVKGWANKIRLTFVEGSPEVRLITLREVQLSSRLDR